MKYSVHIVTKMGEINKFGKLEYKTVSEVVYVDDIKPNNDNKKIRFKPTRVPRKLSEICIKLRTIRTSSK